MMISPDGRLTRRRALAVGALGTVGALAGCLSDDRDPGEQAAGQPLDVPVSGDPEADVVVAAYEDIGCPGCAHFKTVVFPQIESEYIDDGRIRFEHHDFVLPADGATSWEAASAARAVQDMGSVESFWVYIRRLYENQDTLDYETYEELATDLDVDGADVREAAEQQAYDETVSYYTDNAEDAGIEATPTIVVNGSEVEWEEVELEPVAEAIEGEL